MRQKETLLRREQRQVQVDDMNDKDIEQQTRQALDESVSELSPELQQKLFHARQEALSSKKNVWYQQPIIGFALATSFSAVLLINYLPSNEQPDVVKFAQTSIVETKLDDFVFLSQLDETDLEIAEDLEFAYWLSEQLENEIESETLSHSDVRNG